MRLALCREQDRSPTVGHPTRPAKVLMTRPPFRPLIITADPRLLDDLLRCAAAAGVEPEVHADPGAARASWSVAPIVLLGRDLASRAAAVGLPRRDDVVLIGFDLDETAVWEVAFKAGCEQVVFLPDAEGWVVDRLSDTAEALQGPAVSVCLLGGVARAPRPWRSPSPSPVPAAAPR